jgi:hypothetical protein
VHIFFPSRQSGALGNSFCRRQTPFNIGNNIRNSLKKFNIAGCQWLTPLILAIWEADIRRIKV